MYTKRFSLKNFWIHSFLVMTFLLAVSGCGDLWKKDVVKRKLETTRFRANCSLDVNEFVNILDKNISSQIKCLEENLNVFMKIVISGKDGHLGRVELVEYIKNNMPEVKPDVVRALKAVFDINFLITGENPEYISKSNVEKLIQFMLVFNAEAALNFGPIFQSKVDVSFALHQNHRDRVSASAKTIIMYLRSIFNSNRKGDVHKLDILNLLESFTTEQTRNVVEKIEKLLFVKKVLLGGNKKELTHLEIEKILLNFEQYLLISLDLARYSNIILNQESMLQLLKKDISDLYDIVFLGNLGNREEEYLFSIEEAITTFEMFVSKETFDINNYKSLVLEAKKILMGGNDEDVKGLDLKNLLEHGKSLLQTGTVFHRIYERFKLSLESPLPVTINFNEYRHTYPEHQKELNQFERIAKNYRFFKGDFASGYFTRGYRRNADAFFEIALIEYALKLVFEVYGAKSPNGNSVEGYSIDEIQLKKLVLKFENELIQMGLILPRRAETISNNISLLSSLFQYQSDDNKVLDVNEGTEFALSLFSTIDVSKEMIKNYKKIGCETDRFDRVEPSCFRENFFKNFCQKYRDYYPLLFQYLGLSSGQKCEELADTKGNREFLWTSIEAARTCNFYPDGQKEEIWYSEGDIMTILLAIFHAETTIIRWDVNGNNYLDESEVNSAYRIYASALDAFLKDMPLVVQKLKKQIYQYLIKYERVPDEKDFSSIWRFVRFLLRFDKKSPATRKTIVAVLKAIGEQNKKVSTGPKFQCEWLRDPENIPRE